MALANFLGVSQVLAPGNLAFPESKFGTSNGVTIDTRVGSSGEMPKESILYAVARSWKSEAFVAGRLFYTSAFQALGERMPYEEAFSMLRESGPLDSDLTPLDLSHLVIHIRGGDAFTANPNSRYGQPPLAYYVLIVDSQTWSEVTVVSEDRSNPVIVPLLHYLAEKEILHTFQSSSLAEDLYLLLRAQSLVAGRGSFIPAIVGLSRNVQTVYHFGEEPMLRRDLSLWHVIDVTGDYMRALCSSNWRADASQINMMLSYPIEHLRLSPHVS